MQKYATGIAVCLYLAVNAYTDLRRRKIWVPLSAGMIAGGFALRILVPGASVAEGILGLVPGAVMILLSLLLPSGIGTGDGLVLCGCGVWMGIAEAAVMTAAGLFLASAWAVMLIVRKGAGRKDTFAFIPFLLAAQLAGLFVP